ncbi:MAG TPA: glycosyltransferase, partial [Candidatus Latescibacteria bacterium]|nr:glycosyltransferase [Candidatus Latescibacterota bacterium]
GFVPDEELPAHYNLCDVFVLPNRETEESDYLRGDYEGFGIVFLEAGACAKPVIGGRSGGVEEAVVDGVTGLLADPRSTEEVADGVIQLLEDRELARRLGQEGRRRAQEFDWGKLSAKVREILVR